MKLTIDTDAKTLTCETDGRSEVLGLYTPAAFSLISRHWIDNGWAQKYSYTFSWMGRPVIQLPEDLIRIQEVIYAIRPDVIIETGIAHGGSLIYYASLCKAMGAGRVVGIDIEIRPQNRAAIEAHEMFPLITLLEGSSTAPEIVAQAAAEIKRDEKVLVILDSNHTRQHVLNELEAYRELVTPGSYLVATDGGMKDWYDLPAGKPEWREDNPTAAAHEFVAAHSNFVIAEPEWPFNESELRERITYWPSAFIRRIS
ncbi:MAG TPA: CmcI family methyltransferase [Pyrinomonadaceae bacterium]|nr:CmcI family methyltransferase [Pyrinomonadaceae bacterium]